MGAIEIPDQSSPTSQLYSTMEVLYDHFNDTLFEGKLSPVILTVQRQDKMMGYFSANRWGNKSGAMSSELALNPTNLAHLRLIDIAAVIVHEQCHAWQHEFGTPSRSGYHNKEFAEQMLKVGLVASHNGRPGGMNVGQKMADYILEDGPFIHSFDTLYRAIDKNFPWFDRITDENKPMQQIISPYEKPGKPSDFNKDGSPRSKGEAEVTVKVIDYGDEEESSKDEDGDQGPLNSFGDGERFDYDDAFPVGLIEKKQKKKGSRLKYECPECRVKVYGKQNLNIVCGDCKKPFEVEE